MVEMIPVAKAGDVVIHGIKEEGFSFFTSPYAAHREFAAVDLYQGKDFGEKALSPVSGRIHKIMKFDTPSTGKESLPEYLILVRKGDFLARIMHVEPNVEEGEEIEVGDELGAFIKNGFFFYWVDAGMHVEVRRLNDYKRSRGGIELEPLYSRKEDSGIRETDGLTGKVSEVSKRNVKVQLEKDIQVKIGNRYTLLDATTFYDYGGVLERFSTGETVYLNRIRIGKINKAGRYMSIFQMEKLEVSANEKKYKGASFIPNRKTIKLIPEEYGKPLLEKGEKIKLEIKVVEE